jgi:hypothetical protein
MSTIVTRAGKGVPLTNNEVDSNFTNLNADKLEINAALGTPASVTLTNATGLPTAGLVDNAVTNAKLRDSAGLSVIGRGANSTGDPADIVAGTNHQVLRRDGSSLAFGAVDLSSNQAVTGTLPVNQGGTGITSFGSGVAAFLGTPSSANLAAAVTDETGSGALVFATSPTLITPALGTPSSGTLTNATGLPIDAGTTGTLPVSRGGTGVTTAQAEMNRVAQAVTSGQYLRGNGTNVVMSAIQASDVPNLDASKITSGTISADRLPSYVDDVLEFANLAAFPVTGETGKLYVALDTNKVYRWSGSTYVFITSGAVDSVAGKTGVVTLAKADVGLGNVDNTADSAKPVSTAQQTALDLKANIASPVFTGNVTGLGVATGTSFNSITGLSSTTPVVAGTAAVGTGVTAARGDHVHPAQTSVTGNAGTATTLQTARTIGGVSFNGSANINLPGVNTAGNQNTTGTAANVTGTVAVANGGTGQTSYTNGQLLIGNTTGNTLTKATLTAGTGITVTNGAGAVTIAATNNGTVTSVGGTGTVNGITLTGTVTSSGNLTLGGTLSNVSLTTQVTGTLPVANGGTGITSFGAGVAAFLGTPTSANLAAAVTNETGSGALVFATSPTLVTPALGTPSSATLTNATGLPIVAGTTGTLSVARGGTGATTLTANNVILGNGTSAPLFVAPGTSGNVLTSNGSTWTSAVLPAGGLTYVVKTANYTAVDKQGVLADTSGGAFTVTLPATPATGAQVVVADSGSFWGTNNLTVARNGSTIGGLAENLICDITGASVQFVYDGSTWEVYAQIGGQGGNAVTLDGVQTLTNKTINAADNTLIGVTPEDILTPTNVSPADETTDIGETPTLEGSPYYSLYGKTQKSSQWQVSTDPTFATTDYDSGEVLGVGVTHTVPAGNLDSAETYYWRVRYRDIDDVFSEYSTPTEFNTAASFNDFIATPAATPAAFGDAFEGGFYTGLIWNQVTQSATSTTIGTGSKTFTVTDAAPLFYSGQVVEVRSRANPATARMIGTVTGSAGTTLTVNVTSVDGSGTLTDWSIMAKFRIIVAPRSSGQANLAFKNANTAAPTATNTLTEGRKATLAMVADGSSTVYPAAHYCNDLTINTRSDWYFPARDELELAYRNLKPTTDNNASSTRSNSAIDYKNLGSLNDTSTVHGANLNSDPTGAGYTTTVPSRTSVAAFQSGGAEALISSNNIFTCSTQYANDNVWFNDHVGSNAGTQRNTNKTFGGTVRAVRRSII